MNYKDAIKNAKHLKAIGQTEIYVEGDPPWHLAISAESGGSHRLDISTGVCFRGLDPKTGLTFRWSFDIEPMSANDKGHYEIDVEGCRQVLAKLSNRGRRSFQQFLLTSAGKVAEKAEEWKRITARQISDARTLQNLATE